MEVLKLGTKNVVECYCCGSQLRYAESDVYLISRTAPMGGYDDFEPEDEWTSHVNCPVCKKPLAVHVSRAVKRNYLQMRSLRDHDL